MFTAKSIAENLNKFLNINNSNINLIVSGGGIKHPVLMKDIQKYSGILDLKTSNVLGMDPDMKETLLIAVIGVAHMQAIKANMPSVTGAEKMVVLGDLIKN